MSPLSWESKGGFWIFRRARLFGTVYICGEYKHLVDLFNQTCKVDDELQLSSGLGLTQTRHNQEMPAWQTHLKDAPTVEGMILAIRLLGKSSIAERLSYLHSLPADEPYQRPMNLESARGFASFMMNNVYLPYPDITLSHDGRVAVEWGVPGHGTLVLEFLSSEHVEYLDILQQSGSARKRQHSSGVTSIDCVTDAIKLAIHKLISL